MHIADPLQKVGPCDILQTATPATAVSSQVRASRIPTKDGLEIAQFPNKLDEKVLDKAIRWRIKGRHHAIVEDRVGYVPIQLAL
jgi:hypothetical protein